jgi:hypothetical protein
MEHLLKTSEENLASWRTKGKQYFRLSFAIVRPILPSGGLNIQTFRWGKFPLPLSCRSITF